MARRRSIAPENQVGYMIDDLKKAAKANNTKPSGSKHISSGNSITSENSIGEQVIFTNGDVQYFNETIPPVPSAPKVIASLESVVVGWDGTFANASDTVPTDWSHINVYADGNKVAEIRSATRDHTQFISAVDATHVVTFRSVDKAGNHSEPSVGASVTITGIEVDTSAITQRLDAVEGVASSAQGLATSAQSTLSNWASPTDTTIIDGGKIATGSITADKISLGENTNMIPHGLGESPVGWEEFDYTTDLTPFNGIPDGTEGVFSVTGQKSVFTSSFNVSGLARFSFSYWFQNNTLNSFHRMLVNFYDINGALCGTLNRGDTAGQPNTGMRSVIVDQIAPTNAVTARIQVVHNNTGAVGTTYFTDLKLLTGIKTMLTASGLTSYNGATQTVRINGENNLLIGDFISGRQGIEPYVKVSSRTNVGAIDFYPSPAGAANHAGVWYNQGNPDDGLDWGELNIFALNDAPTSSQRTYAAGIKINANGLIDFQGRLSTSSEIKAGVFEHPSNTLTAGKWASHTITFPKAYASGITPRVLLQPENTQGLETALTLQSCTNTGFTYTYKNLTNIAAASSTRFFVHWFSYRT